MRKTITVEYVRALCNKMLLNAQSEEERKAINHIVTKTLLDTGNYAGFCYVTKEDKSISFEEVCAGKYKESLRHYYSK